MANQNVAESTYNLDISMCPEPRLESSQDLDLLAQEIAEAAVEEERRGSNSSSPSPPQLQDTNISCEMTTEKHELTSDDRQELEQYEDFAQDDEVHRQEGRSQSPVDEASWEIVDAEEEHSDLKEINGNTQQSPAQNYSIVRKFLARQDLWQKLKDIGMVCDVCSEESMILDPNTEHSRSISDLSGSCSESMVICDIPQDIAEAGNNEVLHQLLRELPEGPKLPTWEGTIAGAKVVIELERQGGLLVASVRVNHTDLLSALSSLQELASSAGLVSYADVDVQSILARAA